MTQYVYPKSALYLEGFQEVTALGNKQVDKSVIMRIDALLPSGAEKTIWNIADHRKTKYLDMPEYGHLLM